MLRDKKRIESELLVVGWQRGDLSAFERIVKLWERSLFYYVRKIVSSEADAWEVLQETWLNVFRSLKSVRDPAALPAYLYRAARNAAVSRVRRSQLAREEAEPHEVCDETSADPITEFDNAEAVHHALDQLPLNQREVLTLFFLMELSLDEIADLLGIPVGTVKSRLHHARHAIRGVLMQGEFDVRSERSVSPGTAGRAENLARASGGLPEGA